MMHSRFVWTILIYTCVQSLELINQIKQSNLVRGSPKNCLCEVWTSVCVGSSWIRSRPLYTSHITCTDY